MKKSIFAAMAAVVALTIVSCNSDPNNLNPSGGATSLQEVAIVPSSVTLAMGQTQQLTARVTPDEAKATATLTWSSSDEDIASVTETGYVTAGTKEGTATITVTAKQGDKEVSGTCAINVTTYYATLNFNEAVIWDIEDVTDSTVYTVTAGNGEKYKCYLVTTLFRIMSEGLYVNTQTNKLDGADDGVIIDLYAPMYYAEKTLNNTEKNTIFSLGYWGVRDIDTLAAKVGWAGKVDEAEYQKYGQGIVDAWNTYIADRTQENANTFLDLFDQAGQAAISGTKFNYWYYDCSDESDATTCGYYPDIYTSSVPTGLVKYLTLYTEGESGTNDYMYLLDAFEAEIVPFDGLFGFDATYNTTDHTYTLNSNNILYDKTYTYSSGEFPSDEAPVAFPVRVFSQEQPYAAQAIDEQIKSSGKFKLMISNK